MNFCAYTQEGEGLTVPGTNMHAHLFEVRTRTPEAIMGFHTRENALQCFL